MRYVAGLMLMLVAVSGALAFAVWVDGASDRAIVLAAVGIGLIATAGGIRSAVRERRRKRQKARERFVREVLFPDLVNCLLGDVAKPLLSEVGEQWAQIQREQAAKAYGETTRERELAARRMRSLVDQIEGVE